MSYAADDHEAIRRRLEELAAERNLALTGSTIEAPKEDLPGPNNVDWAGVYGYHRV